MNASPSRLAGVVSSLTQRLAAIPEDVLQVLGRFSIAAVFWKSGQTKVEGFVVDLVSGHFELGIPHLSASAIDLFREEYRLPLIPPEIAAPLAATAEHLFPLLLLFGIATRLSALGLLGMTAVIEIFVYPDAYPTHGVWATVLLYLIMRGGGRFALDRLLEKKFSLKL
jgi:putative oxidoreductase